MGVTKTIGLVGGVASGKSRVAQLLVELGAGLVDADRLGHAVLEEDADVQAALRRRWGDDVFAPDGSVNRAAIARRVFGESDAARTERQFLEQLVHPKIGQRLEAERLRLAAAGRPAVVIDAALLFEANWRPSCDLVLFVDVPRELRLERARRRGWSETDFTWREAAQWPIDLKRQLADVSLSNAGTVDQLREAVRQFWRRHIGQTGEPG